MITEHIIATSHWSTYDHYVRQSMDAAVKNRGTYEFVPLEGMIIVRIFETAADLDKYQEEMLP